MVGQKPRRLLLSDRAVRGLPIPKDLAKEWWDTKLTGLGLRVTPKGRRTWFLRTRFDRRQIRVHFGHWPYWTREHATRSYHDAMSKIEHGEDPRGDRTKAPMLGEVMELYLEQRNLAPATVHVYRNAMRNLSALRSFRVDAITTAQVERVIGGLRAKARTAQQAQRFLSQVFRLAQMRELCEKNPAAGVVAPKTHARERVLSAEEISQLIRFCRGHRGNPAKILLLILATGQRIRQWQEARWDWIKDGWVHWPAQVMKSRRPGHRTYLSTFATGVLDGLLRDGPRVLRSKGRAVKPYTLIATISERYGIPQWSTQDLRRTCSTNLGSMRVEPRAIKAILDHAQTGVTDQVYIRTTDAETSEALERWGQYLARLEAGEGADLLEFRHR